MGDVRLLGNSEFVKREMDGKGKIGHFETKSTISFDLSQMMFSKLVSIIELIVVFPLSESLAK